jgi:hypothetical protein
VMSVLLLQKARSWHCHDAGLVNHFQTIQKVRGLPLLLCFLNEFV